MSLFGFFRTPSAVDSTAAEAAGPAIDTSAGSETKPEVSVQPSAIATESEGAESSGDVTTLVANGQASDSGGRELNSGGSSDGGIISDVGSLPAGRTAAQEESVNGTSDLEKASSALHSLLASSTATSSPPNLQESADTAASQSVPSLLSTLLASAPPPPPSSLPLPSSSSPLLTPASSIPTLLTPLAFSSPPSQPTHPPLPFLQAPTSAPPTANRTPAAPGAADSASTSAPTAPPLIAESASTSEPSAPPLGTLFHPSSLSTSHEPPFPIPPSQSAAARVVDLLPWKRTSRGQGHFLEGSDAVLNVDKQSAGAQQLEVTPITVYGSEDSGLPGRQVAVNERYICYALRNAAIRVLNQQTALRALVKGHTGRVTDMLFFAEDDDLLASASSSGLILVHRLSQSSQPPAIHDNLTLAVQLKGPWASDAKINPQLAFHPRQKDHLLITCDRFLLLIVTSVASASHPSSLSSPLIVDLSALAALPASSSSSGQLQRVREGVMVGVGHSAPISSLLSQPASCTMVPTPSQDGKVYFWTASGPASYLSPHDGQPVDSAVFLLPPHAPARHLLLLTAARSNSELKLWVPTVPPPHHSDAADSSPSPSWRCIQTLKLQYSSPDKPSPACRLHVVHPLGLIILADSALLSFHVLCVRFSPSNPPLSRILTLAHFAVALPVLSFTATVASSATSDDVIGLHEDEGAATAGQSATVNIFCVQSSAIQQHTLPLDLCLPPAGEAEPVEVQVSSDAAAVASVELGKETTSTSAVATAPEAAMPGGSAAVADAAAAGDGVQVGVSEPPQLPSLLQSSAGSETAAGAAADQSGQALLRLLGAAIQMPQVVTDSEGGSSSSITHVMNVPPSSQAAGETGAGVEAGGSVLRVQPVAVSGKAVAEAVGEASNEIEGRIAGGMQAGPPLLTPQSLMALVMGGEGGGGGGGGAEKTEIDDSGAASAGADAPAAPAAAAPHEPTLAPVAPDSTPAPAAVSQQLSPAAGGHEPLVNGVAAPAAVAAAPKQQQQQRGGLITLPPDLQLLLRGGGGGERRGTEQSQAAEIKPHVAENATAVPPNEPLPAAVNGSSLEDSRPSSSSDASASSLLPAGPPSLSADSPSLAALAAEVTALQAAVQQVLSQQKDLSRQLTTPITKEGKRLEASLTQRMDKVAKANSDAAVAKLQEEAAKKEKAERERERTEREKGQAAVVAAVVAAVQREVASGVGASVSSAVQRSVQKDVGPALTSKVVPAVEAAVNKAVQPMSGAIAESLRTEVAAVIPTAMLAAVPQAVNQALQQTFSSLVLPAIERATKEMFLQVDSSLKEGLAAHRSALQQQQQAQQAAVEQLLAQQQQAQAQAVQQQVQQLLQPVLAALPDLSAKVQASLSALSSSHSAYLQQLQEQQVVLQRAADQAAAVAVAAQAAAAAAAQAAAAALAAPVVVSQAAETSIPAGIPVAAAPPPTAPPAALPAPAAAGLPPPPVSAATAPAEVAGRIEQAVVAAVDAPAPAVTAPPPPAPAATAVQAVSLESLEAAMDPTKEISKLVREGKYEEAFTKVLCMSDVAMVAWLCTQVAPPSVFTQSGSSLSQGVLLALVQQLGTDLQREPSTKLPWICSASLALQPRHPQIGSHVRPILDPLFHSLHSGMTSSQAAGNTPLSQEYGRAMRAVASVLSKC